MASSLTRTTLTRLLPRRQFLPPRQALPRRPLTSPAHPHDHPILISPTAPVKPDLRDPNDLEEPDWAGDDFTSTGHAELLRHREARAYARLIIYDLPRLTPLSRPFTPPAKSQILRFRYTTYLGESHPAERKVVLEFSPWDLPDLTPVQRDMVVKVAGARFDPAEGLVKISCEMFEERAQNVKYLSDLVDRILEEVRGAKDDFGDVPVDLRHYRAKLRKAKGKVRARFPSAWRMTDEKRKKFAEERAEFAKLFEKGVTA